MPSAEEPLVSVVTPFYNTEEYLDKCITSVLGQDYRNFEYVLVDNCSDDRSLEIAERHAGRDPRIRIVRNRSFLRQLENYNHALRQISDRSRYCKVVQADDWIFPACLSEMVRVAESHPSVGIVGAYTLLDHGESASVYLSGLPYPSTVTGGREVCRRFLLDGTYVFGSQTATLFRSEIVRSRVPFYDDTSVIADVEVCLDVLRSWDFGFVHQLLTYTRRYNDSIMSAVRGFHLMSLAEVIAIRKYGRFFLDDGEFQRRRRRLEGKHRRALGESLLRGRPKVFWDFQRHALAATGERVHWLKLGVWGLAAFLDLALNPKQTVERLARRRPEARPRSLEKLRNYVKIDGN